MVEAEKKPAAYAALSTGINAVLVSDAAITKRRNRELADAHVAYTKDWGPVLFGCLMSTFSTPTDFNRMMRSVSSLPWRVGSCLHDDSPLNEAASTDRSRGVGLLKMIYVKGVYLQHVSAADQIYARDECITPSTMLQQLLEQYVEDMSGQAAVAFGSVGKGYLGWIGDVNSQEELDPVYLALLGLPVVEDPVNSWQLRRALDGLKTHSLGSDFHFESVDTNCIQDCRLVCCSSPFLKHASNF
ncbi:hypothetical protein GJ744_010739 [Endocarpon pusillum]|uniref:Uncharacterized protein n=1 Tax=Endocarpon pusillum TaxID=364733 RepID=A0A8H7ALI9_9EURO|nr:hypothetical protein GJ744_010739 [Endocarpon pusillum]